MVESNTGMVAVPIDGEKLTIGHAARLMHAAYDAITGEDDPVNLGLLGSEMRNRRPDFDIRNYGHKRLSDLVKSTRDFKLKDKSKVMRPGYRA
ncbi:MAG: OST-HTH/LOTUS domain-containing protein [Pseudomonadota bacterium]